MQYQEEAYEPDDEFVGDGPELESYRDHAPGFDVDDDQDRDIPSSSSLSSQEYKYNIPEMIKSFITYFLRQIKEQNVYEIHNLYENSFNKLTEKHYPKSPWPHVEAIKTLVDPERDGVFLVLYKELYYRHIYAKLTPTVEQRVESWNNYCDLFNYLLRAETASDVTLELPNQWLWDITDEFIYQFQAFCQYRSKLKNKSVDEISVLKENPDIWNVDGVLGYLSALVEKSKIVTTLQRERQGERNNTEDRARNFSTHPLYRTLGYFSIIGQLRVQCLLGDYYHGLKALEPIDLTKKGLYTRVTACHLTLYYYLGFSYLMMRRYVDAIKSFSNILLYINRTKQYHSRSYQYEQVTKKHDQVYTLLAITVSLCPQRIDETVHAVLRDKFVEKMIKMQRGDGAVFEELFTFACPKFISPAAPNYDEDPQNYNQDAYHLQLKLFLTDVRQQVQLPIIRSYLKLYSTISIQKLASLVEGMDEASLRTYLLCFKHKTRNLISAGGNPLSGKVASSSDVDFYIDQDMIHIIDSKVTRRYGEFFIRHINKFEEIIKDLQGR